MPSRRTRRSTTTSMVCCSYRASFGVSPIMSASSRTSPSMRARTYPCAARSASSDSYSPLRPRTTGASTWKRVPSGSLSTRSTICWGVWRSTRVPSFGQCGTPMRGVEQPEVVVDLGDRADGRPRVARGGLLVDRDRRRQPLDEVDVGLVHLPEELACVGRQRLDVAALALGVDRVERQRGLAGARQPGEDDQPVARQLDRDVLQVVLTGAPHDERVGHPDDRTAGSAVTNRCTVSVRSRRTGGSRRRSRGTSWSATLSNRKPSYGGLSADPVERVGSCESITSMRVAPASRASCQRLPRRPGARPRSDRRRRHER